MAIVMSILSEFDGAGINKATKQFGQLETAGQKASFAIKKAAVPAGIAIAALGAAAFSAVKGAMADAAAQTQLALAITNNTKATYKAIAANEDWITVQGKMLGVTDDELRPSLARLVSQTHDLSEAQRLASIGMDISAGTSKSLAAVTEALAAAAGGSTKKLAALSPELKAMMKNGMSADEAINTLANTFKGAASAAAETAEGKFKRLQIALAETKESVGASLMPAVEAILPVLQKFGDWAQKNPETFKVVGLAIAGIAASIMLINAAMALNPIGLIVIGIGLLSAAVVLAYGKFEGFRNVVRTVVNGISSYFEFVANAWIKAINIIITGINLVKPGKDIATFDEVSFGQLGGSSMTSAADMRLIESGNTQVAGGVFASGGGAPSIGGGASRGGSTAPRVIPIPKAEINGGGEGMLGFGDIQINVQAGLIGTPITIGQDIIDAIQAAQRANGTVFVAAA